MDLGLRDRVAIVGGSTEGIGLAVAIALAKEGANVAICGNNEPALRRAEIELARISTQHRVLAVPADLSQDRDIRRVVRDTYNRFDQVGILVTHVGHPETTPAVDLQDETISLALERNLYSAVRLSREAVPHMKQQHWGRIINLFSSSYQELGDGMALATLSQMAIKGFFRTLATELAPFNITVNNLVSGPVETESLLSSIEDTASAEGKPAEALLRQAVKRVPMGRLGRPEEVGDVLAFLASDRSSFVTGTTIIADGGTTPGIR